MPYDLTTRLWYGPNEHFFQKRSLKMIAANGPHCVATALGAVAGKRPEYFLQLQREGKLNTQDPVTWSEALTPSGMKLAYLPFDVRKLQYYMEELVSLDDLFLLSYYTAPGGRILQDPDEKGWICGSHVVVLHRDTIFDPLCGAPCYAFEHSCNDRHTKRLFRVVPGDYPRGL